MASVTEKSNNSTSNNSNNNNNNNNTTGEDEEIKQLYQFSEILDKSITDNSLDEAKQTSIFLNIVKYSKSTSTKTKSLAVGQFIPRYFKYFPNSSEQAINALMDLCEEDDLQLRLQGIKAFPHICKDMPSVVPRAADVLGQLLQADNELDTVKQSLVSLFKLDVKGVLDAIFNQISKDDYQRSRAVDFLREKIVDYLPLVNDKEEKQTFLADRIKKVLNDVSEDEFKVYVIILSKMPIYSGVRSNELIDLIADQADLKSAFKPQDAESNSRLVGCLRIALPIYNKLAKATNNKFLSYLSNSVLPVFSEVPENFKIQYLKFLGELSRHASQDDAKSLLPPVFKLLQAQVPTKAKATKEVPKLNFSYIECLLYTFVNLSSKAPPTFKNLVGIVEFTGQPSDNIMEDHDALFSDFQSRMKFLHESTDKYIKQLSTTLEKLEGDKDNSKKETVSGALDTTKSIKEMSTHLLNALKQKSAPSVYVRPSWGKGDKKRSQDDIEIPSTTSKRPRGTYIPPSRMHADREEESEKRKNNNNNNNNDNNNNNYNNNFNNRGFNKRGGRGGSGRGGRGGSGRGGRGKFLNR